MADLLLDEWLWSDLSGENSNAKQIETFQLLDAILNKCDRFISVKGSSFDEKFTRLLKPTNTTQARISKVLGAKFWRNSQKTRELKPDELPELPDDLAKNIKESDQYLVRAYLRANANEFITTDNDLKTALLSNGIDCKHRQDFVASYISKYRKK